MLEVGGGQSSLREALRSMGREVAPPQRLRPPPEPRVGGSGAGPTAALEPVVVPGVAATDPEVGSRQGVVPEPVQELPAAPQEEWVWDELRKDESLSHASYRLLGTSRRWREIMEWNGIKTEEDTRRLPTGFRFKLKRTELK